MRSRSSIACSVGTPTASLRTFLRPRAGPNSIGVRSGTHGVSAPRTSTIVSLSTTATPRDIVGGSWPYATNCRISVTAAIDSWEGSLGGGQTALLVEKCLHFSKQLQPVPLEHQMMRPFAGDHQPFSPGHGAGVRSRLWPQLQRRFAAA